MCLILFAYNVHPEYPLILAANRDEYYQRPTQAFHWWPDAPSMLAGKDLLGGGTWMGITRQGHFAALTNVREGTSGAGEFLSRGLLPLTFLQDIRTHATFHKELQDTGSKYRGYNLLFGTIRHLQYFSNRGAGPIDVAPGVYGLSNARLNTPWPKVVAGKKMLADQLNRTELSVENIFRILASTKIAADQRLPDTGISIELERQLSAICITGENYGTRSSTVLLVNRRYEATVYEKERAPLRGSLQEHSFRIDSQ